ncbi:MAG: cytochrome c [Bacteroidales bacterium]|nr:cytochrome c [Bacteroidales bacterium]
MKKLIPYILVIIVTACTNDVKQSQYIQGGRTVDTITLEKPLGTVPMTSETYLFPKKSGVRDLSAWNTMPEIKFDSLKTARNYQLFCSNCHGTMGKGDGYLVQQEKYTYPVPTLQDDKFTTMSDGEIYHYITVGKGLMGSFENKMTNEERWSLVVYIKHAFNSVPDSVKSSNTFTN